MISSAAQERLRFLRRGEKLPVVKGRCRLCAGPRPPKRRGYCSDGCQDAYLLATDGNYVRLRAFERDEGVCRGCGLDCDHLEVRLWGYSTMRKIPPKGSGAERAMRTSLTLRTALAEELKKFGFVINPLTVTTLWQADHTVPVVDGGAFELVNVQTLCWTCHTAKTSAEAEARARRSKLLGVKWETDARRQGRSRAKRRPKRRGKAL